MKSSWGHTSESLELVPCKEFMGPPGSGAALAQPFEVTMHGQVSESSPVLHPLSVGSTAFAPEVCASCKVCMKT